MSADAASFSELISHVNAILKAFGENALPEDTDAENLLDRLRLVAGRLASGKARQNQDLAGMGLSQSVARRVLARKAQARRTSGRATQDMDRLLRGIERLGGRPQHIPAATWALIIRETERAQQRGR